MKPTSVKPQMMENMEMDGNTVWYFCLLSVFSIHSEPNQRSEKLEHNGRPQTLRRQAHGSRPAASAHGESCLNSGGKALILSREAGMRENTRPANLSCFTDSLGSAEQWPHTAVTHIHTHLRLSSNHFKLKPSSCL